MPLLEPALIAQQTNVAIRGILSFAATELGDSFKRKNVPPMPESDSLAEFGELPSLDEAPLGASLAPSVETSDIPADLFACVVGLESEIRILRWAATSNPPHHVLLIGPPGTAKSLLLEELNRLPDSQLVYGSAITPSGMREMFLDSNDPPRILLVDEIEKSPPEAIEAIRETMDGKVTRIAHGKPATEEDVDCRVIAACNSTKGMDPSILSRFVDMPLEELTSAERERVIATFLVNRRKMEEAPAREIASLIAQTGGDTRDAEQVATMWLHDETLARERISQLGRAGTAA